MAISINTKTLSTKNSSVDIQRIESLLELFNMHSLIPHLSKDEHVYATSLATLISALNWSGNTQHLFEALPSAKNRKIDLLDILNTMANLGFTNHDISINLQNIDNRLMPCLFIPNKKDAYPLVILAKNDNSLTVFDSKKQKELLIENNDIEGTAYFFEQINLEQLNEEKKIKQTAGMNWFNIIFSRFKGTLREIILTSIFINISSLAMPLFIMSIYDQVIASGSIDILGKIIIGVIIAIFTELILRIIRLKSLIWLGARIENIVNNVIFEHLLLIKAAYTEGVSISAQISRIKSFESVRKFFTGPLFSVIIELPFTVILLLTIWIIAGPLVYIPITVLGIFATMMYLYQSKLRISMRTSASAASLNKRYGMETFIKIRSLHHNGLAKNWWEKYKGTLSTASKASFRTSMISSIIDSIAHAISVASGIAILIFGCFLIWDNSITMGALVATMILIWRILGPLQILCSMLPRIEQLKNSIDQIDRLTNIEIEHYPTVLKKPIEHLSGNISLTNIGLRYSTDAEPIFVGLDIDVKPGEIIAITGSNGSGKTSLLKLINGLYKPQTGIVMIDGIHIKQMDPIELRKYISYMPQIPHFFTGTIKDNLLLTNPLATDKDIINVLNKVGAMDMINSFDKGINEIIKSDNPTLPSGFVYKLNLARVFLRKSNIILLDELPRALLNDITGASYKELIKSSKGKNTVFFVSHKNDYIKLADRLIVLKPGTKPIITTPDNFINQKES